MVEVKQDGLPITGSPFNLSIGDSEISRASKVHISGAMKEAKANAWNEVKIDTSSAGLSITLRYLFIWNVLYNISVFKFTDQRVISIHS